VKFPPALRNGRKLSTMAGICRHSLSLRRIALTAGCDDTYSYVFTDSMAFPLQYRTTMRNRMKPAPELPGIVRFLMSRGPWGVRSTIHRISVARSVRRLREMGNR
jgi:hypothetical protein